MRIDEYLILLIITKENRYMFAKEIKSLNPRSTSSYLSRRIQKLHEGIFEMPRSIPSRQLQNLADKIFKKFRRQDIHIFL